ncbi:hypothetical protein FQN57_004416 [Myotisia sp. PD_48]|nr:hypothetical protein FQN57_004416 [Myotisia sp. PD_48]
MVGTEKDVGTKLPTNEDSTAIKPNSDRPACFSNTLQECIFVLTTTMAIGQTAFFQGLITGITASIGKDLNMTSAEITWISAASSLSSGAFLLTFGKLADLFGRKSMFIGAMGASVAALIAAGFAPNALFMDIFSGIIGLCSAAVVPPAVGALGAAYEKPSKRKNIAFSCFSAGNPLGFVGGTMISGVASNLYNWRAAFWALAGIYGLFTAMTIWTVPKDTHPREKFTWETLKKFDITGTLLIVSGLGLFSASLTLAGEAPNGWKTNYVIALLVLGIMFIVGFVYWQSITEYPLMPLHIWKDRNFTLLVSTLCLGFMGFSAMSFWLTLYMQRIKQLNALEIAVQLLPQVINGVIVNIIAGLILHKVNNKLLMGIGAVSFAASFLIVGLMNEHASYWAFIFPSLLLSVVGADIEFNVVNMYVMSSLPPSHQSLAGGIFNTLIKLCSNIGLGMTTAVYMSIENTNPSQRIKPYLSTYWLSTAVSGVGIVLVFFLTIKTQGAATVDTEEGEILPRTTDSLDNNIDSAKQRSQEDGKKMENQRTITEIKLSFLRDQIRILSASLDPSPDWREYGPIVEEAIDDKTTKDVLQKLNQLLKQHNRAVFSTQAIHHVSQQIDRLYWDSINPESDLSNTQALGIDRELDLTQSKDINELPEDWNVPGASQENQIRYTELRERLIKLDAEKKKRQAILSQYTQLTELLVPFNEPQTNIQPNLVTKDGQLGPELDRMRMLLAKATSRIERLQPHNSTRRSEETSQIDSEQRLAKLLDLA